MDRNLPARAGDTGLTVGSWKIPGPVHVPRANKACVPPLLKPAGTLGPKNHNY